MLVSGAAPLCWLVAVLPAAEGATCGCRSDLFASGVRVYARRCVVIVASCSALAIIPCCQEMQAGGPSTACPTLAPSSSATCRMVPDRFIDACFFC